MDAYARASVLGGALQATLANLRFPVAAPIERDVHQQVCDYVDALKLVGMPPERVLLAVKSLANQAAIYATPHLVAPRDRLVGKDKLLVDLVSWTIERYFANAAT